MHAGTTDSKLCGFHHATWRDAAQELMQIKSDHCARSLSVVEKHMTNTRMVDLLMLLTGP